MRQQHETASDLQNEAAIKLKIERFTGWHLVKLPVSYHLDYAAYDCRGILKAWVEIKCRTNKREKYPTYLVAALKWNTAISLSRSTNPPVPFWLAVGFTDGPGLYAHKPDHIVHVEEFNRKDPRDSADMEPMVAIPMGYFVSLPEEPED